MYSKYLIILSFLCFQLPWILAQGAGDVVQGGYWLPDSGLAAPDIDSTLFTHLFCAFATLDNTTYQVTISTECSTFPQTVQKKNPSVITLISIGGGTAKPGVFSNMVGQPESRKSFIDSTIALARSNGYDGLDLDWEQQSGASDMNNMGVLLDEWRAAANAEAAATGNDRVILTAAVQVWPQLNPQTRFPTASIARNLDWINVMAYDFYNPNGSPVTRESAALSDPTGGVSGSMGIQSWINAGVPLSQLVLGFPFYGYAWKLSDSTQHGISSPASGIDTSIGDPQYGTAPYNQIKQQLIIGKGVTVVYNSSYGANYCYSGTTWVGYDDTQSISAKVAYARSTGLLGYFAWHLAQDYNWALSTQAKQAWGS